MPRGILANLNKSPAYVAELVKTKRGSKVSPGTAQIAARLRKLGSTAPNGQPIEFQQVLRLKPGQVVPKAFRTFPQIQPIVGRGGVATAAYTDGWCQSHWNQSGDWKDTWGECWDNSTSAIRNGELVLTGIGADLKSFTLDEFSPAELTALAKFNVGR